MDDDSKDKKAKGTIKSIIKRGFMVKYYEYCLYNDKTILKLQQRFKGDCHSVYTDQINTISLSSNNDKILEMSNQITTYPYGTNAFKVCKSEF